ncbi:hypothetical protein HHI36_019052 [Cryptolaemus montrouzieri]|uniref:Uncharacterized protein n=1 Tax=Cryptolaemus montrouzieri TaxID=559131 RepID=A0ABD2P1U2_9CUCU
MLKSQGVGLNIESWNGTSLCVILEKGLSHKQHIEYTVDRMIGKTTALSKLKTNWINSPFAARSIEKFTSYKSGLKPKKNSGPLAGEELSDTQLSGVDQLYSHGSGLLDEASHD